MKRGVKMLKVDKNKFLIALANMCLTTECLQEKSGVGRTTISGVINGKKTHLQAHVLGKLAKALDVKVEDLI